MGFLTWDLLYNCALNLEDEFHAAGELDQQKPLPEKLETALVNLAFAAEMTSTGMITVLKMGMPASPPIRERFVREPQQPGSSKMQTRTKGGSGNDPLLQLFTMLWDEQKLFLAQLPNVVDEMQRCIDHDSGQKARMSTWVTGYFSDLALAAQLVKQVKTFYPWAAGLELSMSPESRRPTYEKATEDTATVYLTLREEILPNLARIIVPLQKKLYYPVEKARNAANVDACRQAEAQLDKMWKTLDSHFLKHTKKTLHDLFPTRGVSPREIRRMPAWTPPAPRLPQTPKGDEALQDDLSRLTVESEKPGRPRITEVPRAKIKTRGTPRPSGSANAAQEIAGQAAAQPQTNEIPTFTLARRAWKVFSTMFHNPSENDHAGEITWPDFLHAMTATGFAAEKLYGSVWQFTPTRLDVENGINIHEPHPSGKIPFRTARRLGRRLFRTYGLTGESFRLA